MAGMPTISSDPRWKSIHDQLLLELPTYEYGSNFYTIADICKKFDVSIITARRVLDELAAQGLVEKIRKRGTVVRRLQKATAIRLVVSKGMRVGPESFSVTIQRQLAGLTQFAREKNIDFDTISETHLELVFARKSHDIGLLLRPGVTARSIEFIRTRNIPYVLLDPADNYRGQPHARADRRKAGYMAASHLISLGHRRIAYMLGSISQRNFRSRLLGYRAALQEAGIKFDWALIKETDGEHYEQDEVALEALLALPKPPTAIMTGDDSRAIRVMESCRLRGIDVPRDMSILAYPSYPESKLMDPPLSVLDARFEDVGAAAMKLLVSQMYEKAVPARQAVVIDPMLVERGSTAPAPKQEEA